MKVDSWEAAVKNKMMRLASRLAIALTTGEHLKHRQAQYDAQARQCEQSFPRWFDWFQHGGEYRED